MVTQVLRKGARRKEDRVGVVRLSANSEELADRHATTGTTAPDQTRGRAGAPCPLAGEAENGAMADVLPELPEECPRTTRVRESHPALPHRVF